MSGIISEAFVRIRPQMGGFKEEMKAGVAEAFTSVDAALADTAAGTTKVSAGFEDIVLKSKQTVAAFVETRNALRMEVRAYGELAAAAQTGSAEQVAASRLAANAERELARSYEVAAATASASAKKASTAQVEAASVTKTSMEGVKASMMGIKGVGAVLAGGVLGKFVWDSAKDAASVQKSSEVIQATFGKSAQSVINFADKGGVALGIAGHVTEGVSAKFGILFKNMGIGQGQAATMTLGLEKLGGSLAAIRGIDPSQALQSLNMAMLGNMRSLKQLGLSFSNAQITQEAMRLGILKTKASTDAGRLSSEALAIARARLTDAERKYGANTTQVASAQKAVESAQAKVNAEMTKAAGALTPATKAQAIYALATKNLGDYQKQAAAHSGDLANVQRRLSAEWDLAREKLGTALLPVIAGLVKFLADDLPHAFGVVTGFMKRWQDVLAPLAGAVGAIVVAFAAWKVGMLAWAAADAIAAAAYSAFVAVVSANPFTLVVIAIVGLVGALAVLYERSRTVRDAINAVWGTIKDAAVKVWGYIRTYVLDVWDAIKTGVETYLKAIVDVFHVFTSLFTGNWRGAWNSVKKLFSDVWDGMSRIASDVLDVIRTYVERKALEIGLAIIEPFSHIPRWLGGGWAQDLKKSMTGTLDGLKGAANQGGQNIGGAIVNGVQTGLSPLQTVISQAVQSSVSQSTAASPGRSAGFQRKQNLTEAQMAGLLMQAGAGNPQLAAILAHIAYAGESGGNAGAVSGVNKNGTRDYGLFQINSAHGYSKQDMLDPLKNAQEALAIYHSQGFGAWTEKYGRAAAAQYGNWLGQGGTGGTGLTVGKSGKSAAAAAQSVAQSKASLEQALRGVIANAQNLGTELTATIRKHMAAVRAEITGISSKADVAKARLNLSELSKEVSARLAQLKTEIALNNTFDGLKTSVAKLGTDVTPQIRVQMRAIQAEIGKVSTPQQIADVRRQMTLVKNELAAQLKQMQAQVSADKTRFDQAWQVLASGADAAFQRATTKALNAMQVTVTGAFSSFAFGGTVTQTPAEVALQQLQDAKTALDQQSALEAAQDKLAQDSLATSTATADQITADQKAVQDAQYQIRITALQAQAAIERAAATKQLADAQTAYQDQRALLQQQMDARVADIQQGMLNGSIAAADGMAQLTGVLSDPAYGIDMQNSGLVIGTNLYTGISQGLQPIFDLFARLAAEAKALGMTPGGTTSPTLPPGVVGGGVQSKPGGKVVDSTGGYYDPSRGIYVQGPAAAAAAKTQQQILDELKKANAKPSTVTVNVDGSVNSVAKMVAR